MRSVVVLKRQCHLVFRMEATRDADGALQRAVADEAGALVEGSLQKTEFKVR